MSTGWGGHQHLRTGRGGGAHKGQGGEDPKEKTGAVERAGELKTEDVHQLGQPSSLVASEEPVW